MAFLVCALVLVAIVGWPFTALLMFAGWSLILISTILFGAMMAQRDADIFARSYAEDSSDR